MTDNFEEPVPTGGPESGLHLMFIDGAKMANVSGEASAEGAIAAILKDPAGKREIAQVRARIGPVPDPHAVEYRALIAGLDLAKSNGIEYVAVFSDSRTVVNQINGIWQRNAPHLDELYEEAVSLLMTFPHGAVQFSWVPREWNREADNLVRETLTA